MTRYDMAVSVARLLAKLPTGGEAGPPARNLIVQPRRFPRSRPQEVHAGPEVI
jgi:hypothetical protein